MSGTRDRTSTGAVLRAPANVDAEGSTDSARVPGVETRLCPTRTDGSQPLIQLHLSVSACQSKQRGMYHKCHTCAHANLRS